MALAISNWYRLVDNLMEQMDLEQAHTMTDYVSRRVNDILTIESEVTYCNDDRRNSTLYS